MLATQSISRQRGDTLIEVLFAITIFSLIVVATLAIMNQGTAAARRSVEMTLVRDQIDAQAETLRFLHESYVAKYVPGITYSASDTTPAGQYAAILKSVQTTNRLNATPFTGITSCPTSTPSGGFIVNSRTAAFVNTAANLVPAVSYAQMVYPASGGDTPVTAQGIWIEGIHAAQTTDPSSGATQPGYDDFYIRACWAAPGQNVPLTMGTIVRLYEPAS